MNAMRNMVHGAALATWAVLGIIFTIKVLPTLFGSAPVSGLFDIASFWIWLAAFGAVTTAVVSKFKSPIAAIATHAGAVAILMMVPKVFPLSLIRLGVDLLTR
jgi:hypothetical protein